MSEENCNVCDLHEPLKHTTAYQLTRKRLRGAKTKQDRINALVEFGSFHGLFSDDPALLKHARCES